MSLDRGRRKTERDRAADTNAADGPQRIRSATDAPWERIEEADAVDDSPVLICYDGSEGARNAIAAAAASLVGPNEPPLS
jgi:hypothetical protein